MAHHNSRNRSQACDRLLDLLWDRRDELQQASASTTPSFRIEAVIARAASQITTGDRRIPDDADPRAAFLPTPAEISAECSAIRKTWSREEAESRMVKRQRSLRPGFELDANDPQ